MHSFSNVILKTMEAKSRCFMSLVMVSMSIRRGGGIIIIRVTISNELHSDHYFKVGCYEAKSNGGGIYAFS